MIAMRVCWSTELFGKVSLKLITSVFVIQLIRVLNIMAVWSLLTENAGKPHKSSPQSFIRTFLSCSVFCSSALRGFLWVWFDSHWFSFSHTQIYSPSQPPVVRVTKGPLFSEVTTTFTHIKHTLRLYNMQGKTQRHLHFSVSLIQIVTTIYSMWIKYLHQEWICKNDIISSLTSRLDEFLYV